MASSVNRQVVLVRQPTGLIETSDFELRETPIPVPGEGEVLVRNLWISVDPTQRGWLNGRRSYMKAVLPGDVMRAWCSGEIVESRLEGFRAGERVWGTFGWTDYWSAGAKGIFPLAKVPRDVPLTYPLGVTGITGVTAYVGMLDLAGVRAGETVVVSGAAGATGSVAAQLARMRGARVIGIAGGPEKCRFLRDELRLDGAIDYKNESLVERLKELVPRGVDVYFDNVGGETLDTLITWMRIRGRIAQCGGISQGYGNDPGSPIANASFLRIRDVTLRGFLIFNHLDRFEAAAAELLAWVRSGELIAREDVIEGLENAPLALRRVFEGRNVGKQLVKVAEPSR